MTKFYAYERSDGRLTLASHDSLLARKAAYRARHRAALAAKQAEYRRANSAAETARNKARDVRNRKKLRTTYVRHTLRMVGPIPKVLLQAQRNLILLKRTLKHANRSSPRRTG